MLTLLDLEYRKQKRYEATYIPTVTAASAYTAGNAIGGLITIGAAPTNSNKDQPFEQPDLSLILQSALVVDLDNQKVNSALYLFNAAPTTPVDKTAYSPVDADMKKLIAVIPIVTADFTSINSRAWAQYKNLGQVIKCSGQQLFGAWVTTGTPTWTNGLQLKLQFSQGM